MHSLECQDSNLKSAHEDENQHQEEEELDTDTNGC